MTTFQTELTKLINDHCEEEGSHTPDFILASFMDDTLEVFNRAVRARDAWRELRSNARDGAGPTRPANTNAQTIIKNQYETIKSQYETIKNQRATIANHKASIDSLRDRVRALEALFEESKRLMARVSQHKWEVKG